MAHVLIIEDDSMIAAIERDFLEANGFEVSVAMTGKEGMKIFDSGTIEAVLLDIGLPDTDGFMLCRKLRDISNVPILFITARGSDDDKIKGLGLGADDYIVKPFNPSEMMARLKAHLEIHQRLLGVRLQDADDNKPDIQVGDLRIFIKRHQVSCSMNSLQAVCTSGNIPAPTPARMATPSAGPSSALMVLTSQPYISASIWRQMRLLPPPPQAIISLTSTFISRRISKQSSNE